MIFRGLLALSLARFALAQSIDYSQLPACAQQCGSLTQANQACVDAPVYLVCFCHSGYLTDLSTDASAICPSCTSTTDLQSIVSWYANLCSAGAQSSAAAASATATTVVATTGTAASAATAATAAATDLSGSAGTTGISNDTGNSWWSLHYKWIIMVIVLIAGFGLIIVLGVCLKRRYNRKRNEAGNLTPPPAPWAPGSARNANTSSHNRNSSGRNSAGDGIVSEKSRAGATSTYKPSKLRNMIGR